MRRTMAAASAVLMLGFAVPTAEAAPYVASCNSGVLAPQICTFVASAVVAGFATPGQHLVLTRRVATSSSRCPDGRAAHVEEYRGQVRRGSDIRAVALRLTGCPDAHPVVTAGVSVANDFDYGVWAAVLVAEGRAPSFSFSEGAQAWEDATYSEATADLFRRDTGMSAYTSGKTYYCPPGGRTSGGYCEMGSEHRYTAQVDSSVSGHWARLQLVVSSESDDVEDRTVKVTSQPYGNGGWKITRVS